VRSAPFTAVGLVERGRGGIASVRAGTRAGIEHLASDRVLAEGKPEFDALWEVVEIVPGWFARVNAAGLYRMLRSERPRTIVEIGSYLGRSTVFFGRAIKQLGIDGRIVSVDPHTGDRHVLEQLEVATLPSYDLFAHHLNAAAVEDVVTARVMTSAQAALEEMGPVDLLYVDGWHSYDAVVADGKAWLPKLSDKGVVVFDDYLMHGEVAHAVEDLSRSGAFHLWGTLAGQAVGGRAPVPPPGVDRALAVFRSPVVRYVYRRRPGSDVVG
jgi:predicted O-methyltransferase YrrM